MAIFKILIKISKINSINLWLVLKINKTFSLESNWLIRNLISFLKIFRLLQIKELKTFRNKLNNIEKVVYKVLIKIIKELLSIKFMIN